MVLMSLKLAILKMLNYITHCLIQVGACIVNSERKIVGIGYNGMPNRCSDDELPWQREADDKLDTKYPYGKSLFCTGICLLWITFNSRKCVHCNYRFTPFSIIINVGIDTHNVHVEAILNCIWGPTNPKFLFFHLQMSSYSGTSE